MKRFNRRRVGVLSVCALGIAACVAIAAAGQANQTAAKKWPPQFPREGATKLFENDRVIVWEQVGRPKDPQMHKHIRDILTFGLDSGGGIEVVTPPGETPDRNATQTIRSGAVGSLSYTKAGLGPHAEVMKDPNRPGRSIFVELKGTEPKDCAQWSTACQ